MRAPLSPAFRSRHLELGLHATTPGFAWFDVDGLGGGAFAGNVVLAASLPAGAHARHDDAGGTFRYTLGPREVWHVTLAPERIELRSDFAGDDAAAPFVLPIDQTKNHATVLGRPVARLALAAPALLHLPDRGTLRITTSSPATLRVDARRRQPEYYVRIEFPAATRDRPHVVYTLEVAPIHPALPGLAGQPRYDGYRRNFLNLLQFNPRLGTLANNSSSDACWPDSSPTGRPAIAPRRNTRTRWRGNRRSSRSTRCHRSCSPARVVCLRRTTRRGPPRGSRTRSGAGCSSAIGTATA